MAAGKFKLIVGPFTIRVVPNDATEGFTFHAEGPNGDGRFLEIQNGGGHIELNAPGSITTGTGLVLDGTGHAVFNLV